MEFGFHILGCMSISMLLSMLSMLNICRKQNKKTKQTKPQLHSCNTEVWVGALLAIPRKS